MKNWDNDKHEEILDRKRESKRIKSLELEKLKSINFQEIMIVSRNEQRNTYLFNYAVQTLSKAIIRYDIKRKTIELNNFMLRFMSDSVFERSGQYGFRGKVIYGESLEKALDKYKEQENERQRKADMEKL